ncbi:MAG: DUF362 domain-containing protein [Candidatus Helarchaeota archaeon]
MADIFISYSEDRKKFVNLILNKFKSDIKGKIFLKLNIVSHELYPTTTNLGMVEAVLKFLDGYEVVAGDASAVDCIGFNVKKSEINKLCEKYTVPLINLYNNMKVMKTETGFKFKVAQDPLNFDTIISLPILKVHGHCEMTGALKNAFGYLSKGERIKCHTKIKNIHKAIAELNTIFKPTFTIMDGIETLLKTNEVRHGGKKFHLGILLAGKDPVALDSYGLKLLQKFEPKLKNKSPMDIKQIKYAIDLNIGNSDYNLVELT